MSGGLAVTVAPSGADVRPVTDIEGVEDVSDAERRGVEDVDGAADVDDFNGAAGVNNAGIGSLRNGRSLLVFVFRCAGHSITRRKGTGWKTSVVSRVSTMPMLPRVSIMSGGYSTAAMVLCFGGGHGTRTRTNTFPDGTEANAAG